MSEKRYTAGPWYVAQPWAGFSAIHAGDGPDRKLVFGLAAGLPHEKQHDDICTANARLISAAPDLLSALEAIVTCDGKSDWSGLSDIDNGHHESIPSQTEALRDALQLARTAIAKALGQ